MIAQEAPLRGVSWSFIVVLCFAALYTYLVLRTNKKKESQS